MARKFLSTPDWDSVLNGSFPVTETESPTISQICELKEKKEIIFSTPPISEKVNYDGYSWSKTIDGKRFQPAYRKYKRNGCIYTVVQCTEANNPNFRKELLHLSDKTLIRYSFDGPGDFPIPSASDLKKQRLGGEVSHLLKSNIMPQRSSASAYTIAQSMGFDISKKQILNMRRAVPTALVGKGGKRVSTNLEEIKNIAQLYPDRLEYFIDQRNELVFRFYQIDEDALRVFAAGCPLKAEYDNWKEQVEKIRTLPVQRIKESLAQHLAVHPSGLIFSSRLFVDTTFNLSDCYVTIILAESPHFRTKASGKPRVFPIAYMCHSHKDAVHHEYFSSKLKLAVRPFLVNRSAPAMLMDGEASLQVYADAFKTRVLRCDFHISKLLSHTFGKVASKAAVELLYGYKDSVGTWKSGLLGSFSEAQFTRRLQKVKTLVDSKIYEWIVKNQKWLISTATTVPKLKCGLILQYATTNPSENFNRNLKIAIPRPMTALKLVEKLNAFNQEKVSEIRKSATGCSANVILNTGISNMTEFEKKSHFEKIGLTCTSLLSYDPPNHLTKNLVFPKCQEEELLSENIRVISTANDAFVLEDSAISLNTPNRITIVSRVSDVLECASCNKTVPEYFCKHLLACLRSMSRVDRSMELWRLSDSIRNDEEVIVPQKSGKKPSARIGSRASSANFVRRMTAVSNLTVFDSENGSENNDPLLSAVNSDLSIHDRTEDNYSDGAGPSYSNPVGTESTFSPIFSSTRYDDDTMNSSKRQRRSTRRYSPSSSMDVL